jgi:hypothetical protein
MLINYFYYIKVLQISQSIYYKLNEGIDVFKMKQKMFFNLLSCVSIKNCHIFKWGLNKQTFFGLIYHAWTKLDTKIIKHIHVAPLKVTIIFFSTRHHTSSHLKCILVLNWWNLHTQKLVLLRMKFACGMTSKLGNIVGVNSP